MFTIAFDAPAQTLHLKLEGFWTTETLGAFATELLVKTTELRERYESFAILSDSSGFPVQSPAIAAGFEQIRDHGAAVHKGPTAIVVASVLNKLQAERSLRSPNIRVFLSADAAREWLAQTWRPTETAGP